MAKLWLDCETFSAVPLNHGTAAYAAACEVMIITYALDDGPVRCWDRTLDPAWPEALYKLLHLDDSVEVWAHNSYFDRTVMGVNAPPIERWRCTLVMAYAHGLPGSLGKLGEILGLPEDQQKMKEGKELIHLFCKPRPKNSELRRATRHTHPEEWELFKQYAIRDTETMRTIGKLLPTWGYPNNRRELELWFLDQHINDRGIAVDVELARAAVRATKVAKAALNEDTVRLTDDHVERATQRDKLLAYLLLEWGVDLPDMQAATLELRLRDENLPDALRELIAVRLQSSMTSQTKYQTALNAVSADGRVRGALQFDGAQRTGRWAGRILQPQNFVRPWLMQDEIDRGILALKLGVEGLL